MRVVPNVHDLGSEGPVLAIGNFDGVHVGHRALLARMREIADAEGRTAAVVTFFPPAKVLFAGASYLSSREEKLSLLTGFAPDAVAMVPFTHEYAATDKAEFLAQLASLSPRAIVVGEDFRFGRGREGGLDDLQHVPERLEVFRLLHDDHGPVKSSRIREHLASGEVEAAADLLGAPYLATGTVVRGEERGRTIQVPTANLDLPPEKALPVGVFAVRAETPAGSFGGMANVGPRPSFPGAPPALEAHLFEFDGDLYGATVTVHFLSLLRRQRRFDGLADLRAQLERDRQDALARLARDDGPDARSR